MFKADPQQGHGHESFTH